MLPISKLRTVVDDARAQVNAAIEALDNVVRIQEQVDAELDRFELPELESEYGEALQDFVGVDVDLLTAAELALDDLDEAVDTLEYIDQESDCA